MKKTLLTIATLSLVATTFAQQTKTVRFGVKGGLNISHINGDYSARGMIIPNKYDYSAWGPGFHIGGLAEVSFPKGSKFKLQGEVLYNYNAFSFSPNVADNRIDLSQKLKMHSIQVPLSVKYFFKPQFSMNVGIDPTFNIGGNLTTNDVKEKLSDIDSYKPFMLGVHIGADYYIQKGFFVSARYNYFVTDAFHIDNNFVKENFNMGTIQLGFGYKFK